jgi:hypothetical protein
VHGALCLKFVSVSLVVCLPVTGTSDDAGMRNRAALVGAIALAGLAATTGVAGAADQPVAGQATLSNAAPLPKWPTLQQYVDGGFSGLSPVPDTPGDYWTVSDRGPNGEPTAANGTRRPFMAPGFGPTIYRIRPDTATGDMTIVQRIPIMLPAGKVDAVRAADPTFGGPLNQITGLGNTALNAAANVPTKDETPTTDTNADGAVTTADADLPYDPYGLDTEGIVVDSRDGSFWLTEEYRPSVVHVAADGTMLQRYTPAGQSNASLGAAFDAVPLSDILPAEYSYRRENRGFEGVAIDPSGTTLYGVVQNGLLVPCAGNDPFSGTAYVAGNNRVFARIAKIDITNPAAPVLLGDFLYPFDVKADGTLANANLRLSDLFWAGPDRLIVDERDDSDGTAATGQASTTYKKLYTVDLTGATNLKNAAAGDKACVDAVTQAALPARGITAGTKTLTLDVSSTSASPEYPISKLEGVTKLPNGNIAVVNDNDFQVNGPRPSLFVEYGVNAPTPVVPEVGFAVLLPLAGLAVGGVIVLRRRRTTI